MKWEMGQWRNDDRGQSRPPQQQNHNNTLELKDDGCNSERAEEQDTKYKYSTLQVQRRMEKSDLEEEKKRTEVKNGRDPPKGLSPISTSTSSSGGGLFCRDKYIDSQSSIALFGYFVDFLFISQ